MMWGNREVPRWRQRWNESWASRVLPRTEIFSEQEYRRYENQMRMNPMTYCLSAIPIVRPPPPVQRTPEQNLRALMERGPPTEPSGIMPYMRPVPDWIKVRAYNTVSAGPVNRGGQPPVQAVALAGNGLEELENMNINPVNQFLGTLAVRFPGGDIEVESDTIANQDNSGDQALCQRNLVRCFSCLNCYQFREGNMFACTKEGHVMCGVCFGNPVLDANESGFGLCRFCKKEGGIRRSKSQGLVDKFMKSCEFTAVGCNEKVVEMKYEEHVSNCEKAFRCFLCKEPVPRNGWLDHLVSDGAGHAQIAYLKPRVNHDGKLGTPLEFDIKIPYMGPFAMFVFDIEGHGSFALYQLVVSKFRTMWFLMRSSPIGSPNLVVQYSFEVTGDQKGCKQKFQQEWINNILPWRTRLIYTLADLLQVDPEFETTFNFDFANLNRAHGLKEFRCRLKLNITGDTAIKWKKRGLVQPNPSKRS